MAYLTHFSIPALLNPMINKMADEASAILILTCSHEIWVKVIYDWSTALCLCLCLCRPRFHLLTHVLVLMRTLILMREWKPGFTLLRERKMTCSQHFPIYLALTDCAPIVTCFKSVPCLSSLTCEQALWGALAPGQEKEGELATASLEFKYLHRKSRCEILIGRDDRFLFALIGRNLTAHSTWSHRGSGVVIQIPET